MIKQKIIVSLNVTAYSLLDRFQLSEKSTVVFFRVEELPWMWSRKFLRTVVKHSTRWHDIKSQERVIFKFIVVRIWNFARLFRSLPKSAYLFAMGVTVRVNTCHQDSRAEMFATNISFIGFISFYMCFKA
jgi:hypothetical protein